MRLTIDRKTWLRGDVLPSSLLDRLGRRCCLGFLAKACGIDDESMRGVGMPQTLGSTFAKKWLPGILEQGTSSLYRNTEWTARAVSLNDAKSFSDGLVDEKLNEVGKKYYPEVEPGDDYRERLLTAHFAKIGVELEFVD